MVCSFSPRKIVIILFTILLVAIFTSSSFLDKPILKKFLRSITNTLAVATFLLSGV
jgi:hypothetical protein